MCGVACVHIWVKVAVVDRTGQDKSYIPVVYDPYILYNITDHRAAGLTVVLQVRYSTVYSR